MKVKISGALLRFADYKKDHDVKGKTISACLVEMSDAYPELKPVLFDGEGNVRKVHQLFINGEQITAEDGLDTEYNQDDDCLEVLTAVAGG